MTLIIDDLEERNSVILDGPGAYLHTDILKDNIALLRLRGYFVDNMYEVNIDEKEHVLYDDGEMFLYLSVVRDTYGYIE